MGLFDRLKAITLADVWDFGAQAAKILTVVSPVLIGLWWWGVGSLDAQAQEYVKEIIAPSIGELTAKVEESTEAQAVLTEELSDKLGAAEEGQAALVEQVEALAGSVETLIRRSSAESSQSIGEAETNRQILCLLKQMTDGGAAAECEP